MFAFLMRSVVLVLACVALLVPAGAGEGGGNEHLVMGNPSGATADRGKPNNYLVKKRQYALSYNSSKGTPNWVSWHLSKKWRGDVHRKGPFAPDTSLPGGFLAVRPNDYQGSGFDRGHLCPAGDRSASREDMDATFLMTNMVPQAPDLNRKAWENLEKHCRRLTKKELYIVAGPAGRGGFGSEGYRTYLRGNKGNILVPGKMWKVVLVLPEGITGPRKVTAEARTIAVIMPNIQGLGTDWKAYRVSVKDVEELTGYTFFGNLPVDVARELKTGKTDDGGKVTAKKGNKDGGLAMPAFEKGCVVANRKTKKYHVPHGRSYESARKSTNAVFFKSAADATKAGYTPASR